MDENWLLLTLPLIVVSAVLLWKTISALIVATKAAEIATLPLAGGGDVVFNEAGEIMLALRGRLGTGDFAQAKFALLNDWGKEVPSRAFAMRTRMTNLSGETTLSVCSYTISVPGRYRLNVTGIDSAKVSANSCIVFLKQTGLALVMRILLIVLSAIALIASFALSAIIIASLG